MIQNSLVLHAIGIFVIVLGIQGCSHTVTLRPETLPQDTDEQILVFVGDGRTITFRPGEYNIVTSDSGRVLQGEGREFKDSSRTKAFRFTGSIPLVRVDSVQVNQYGALSTTAAWTLAVTGTAIVLTGLFFWLFHVHFTMG
jgi:hypothetical protein